MIKNEGNMRLKKFEFSIKTFDYVGGGYKYKMAIPKIVHYCWFGGKEKPDDVKKCIKSWKQHLSDYRFMEWNEKNFDINNLQYTKEAYHAKKYAFVSDVARIEALYQYGGIYMDTDVELIKPIDSLLQYEAVSGFESEKRIPTGLMGCKKNQELFIELLNSYIGNHFKKIDGDLDTTTNVTRITDTCLKYGLSLNNTKQTIKGFTLLPNDYLCPKNVETGEITITENTLCIHHFDGSWLTVEARETAKLERVLKKMLPGKIAGYMAKGVALIKVDGMGSFVKEGFKWVRKKRL